MTQHDSTPKTSIAHYLVNSLDHSDYVAMLALMAHGRPYRPEDQYADCRAMLADGSSIAIQDGEFVFEANGETFAKRIAPEGAVLPPFRGDIDEWKVSIHLEIAASEDDLQHPQHALAVMVRTALPNIEQPHVSIVGNMTQENLRLAFPNTPPREILGVQLQHHEGPGVLRPDDAYTQLDALAEAVNEHTNLQRRPRHRDDISLGGYDGLLSICEEILDLDWRVLQTDLIDPAFICRRAAELCTLLEPDPSAG